MGITSKTSPLSRLKNFVVSELIALRRGVGLDRKWFALKTPLGKAQFIQDSIRKVTLVVLAFICIGSVEHSDSFRSPTFIAHMTPEYIVIYSALMVAIVALAISGYQANITVYQMEQFEADATERKSKNEQLTQAINALTSELRAQQAQNLEVAAVRDDRLIETLGALTNELRVQTQQAEAFHDASAKDGRVVEAIQSVKDELKKHSAEPTVLHHGFWRFGRRD